VYRQKRAERKVELSGRPNRMNALLARQKRLLFAPPFRQGSFLKFLARSLGLVLVAAGFVGLVIDGTRSIVNNSISFASLAGMINALVPGGISGLQEKVIAQIHPLLWDPVLLHVVQLPASVTAFFLGAFLLWLGQKPLEPIGYLAGR
jgi:hypothetical protein